MKQNTFTDAELLALLGRVVHIEARIRELEECVVGTCRTKARLDERASIVAWLRSRRPATDPTENLWSKGDVRALRDAADAIELGIYRPDGKP